MAARVALSPLLPPLPKAWDLLKGHNFLILIHPSVWTQGQWGCTWAHRGAARLLLGGLSWAGCVPKAGAESGTMSPARDSSRDKAALGAGGPGCPGCPAQHLYRGT